MNQLIIEKIQPGKTLRILEIGCGAGDQMLNLANSFAQHKFLGIDLSVASIEAAQARIKNLSSGSNLEFRTQDYLKLDQGEFDIIFLNSVLDKIPVSITEIFMKLARDLAPNGTIFINTPTPTCRNYLLYIFRRILSGLRKLGSDRLINWWIKTFYSDLKTQDYLRTRIEFLYFIPSTSLNAAALRQIRDCAGLALIEVREVPTTSILKPTHATYIFKRELA